MSSTVTVLGHIGADAERRETQNGTPYLTFTVADSRSKQNAAGEWETVNTTWRRVSTFNGVDYMAARLVKGARVVVTGSEELRTWDKEDGTKGYRLDVTAHSIDVVSAPNGTGAPAQVQTSPVSAYPATAAPVQQGYAQQVQSMQGGYAPPANAAPPAGYAAAANASSGWGGYDSGATPF